MCQYEAAHDPQMIKTAHLWILRAQDKAQVGLSSCKIAGRYVSSIRVSGAGRVAAKDVSLVCPWSTDLVREEMIRLQYLRTLRNEACVAVALTAFTD